MMLNWAFRGYNYFAVNLPIVYRVDRRCQFCVATFLPNMSVDRLTIWNRDSLEAALGGIRKIAIVGNGTVESESTLQVASADAVVRFNNWATRTECVESTLPNGTARCDILVTHLDLHSNNMGKAGVGTPRQVVLGIPAPFQIDSVPQKLARWHPNTPVAMVNPYWNRQLCTTLSLESLGFRHPLPTLGLTALYHLARMKLSCEFYVCGFDWHYDPDSDRIQGHDIETERLPGHFNHWYIREAVWVSRSLFGLANWNFSARATRTLTRLKDRSFAWEAHGHVVPLAAKDR
ncbi:MAG: hypothetical protein QM775_09580 [Pirellulales bacterium]